MTALQPEQLRAPGGSFVHLGEVHGGTVISLQFVVAALGLCHQGGGLLQQFGGSRSLNRSRAR